MPTSNTNQFQMLRARVENSLEAPYALVVSSAMTSDGKGVCAQGLAESMAAAGHTTLLIDLDHEQPRLNGLPAVASLTAGDGFSQIDRALTSTGANLTVLSLASDALAASASKESVSALIAHLRSRFDAVIVEAGALVDSSIGLLFASVCDGVILTAREGRSVRERDRATVEVIEREHAKFLGVVTVGARKISEFERQAPHEQVRVVPATLSKSLVR